MPDQLATPKRPYWDHPIFKWLALAMAAMLYLMNMSPHVGFNDSLSFLLEASQGFSPYTNATSHFLYNNVLHLLLEVFFFLPPIPVLTVFSVMCSVAALIRIYQICRVIVGPFPTAMVPPMFIALSFTFWQQSEIIEVYAFNNLIFLSFLYFALKDLVRHKGEHVLQTGLLLGLATLVHIQNILAVPFFIYYLVAVSKSSVSRALLGGAVWAALCFVLFLPPLIADTNSISSIFFDNKFKDNVMGMDMGAMGEGMLYAMVFLMYNFHMFLMFIVHGWVMMWRQRRVLFWQLTLLFIPYFLFAMKYAVADNHVFFLVPYLVLVIPSIFSLNRLIDFLMPKMSWMMPMMIAMPIMMYAGMTMMGKRMPMFEKYRVEKAYKGGAVHLLWPGKMWAKDPLALAEEVQANGGLMENGEAPEWNYPAAKAYLALLKEE